MVRMISPRKAAGRFVHAAVTAALIAAAGIGLAGLLSSCDELPLKLEAKRLVEEAGQTTPVVPSLRGVISTIAGTGVGGYSSDGGLASSAQLNNPNGVTVDTNGNIFIADTSNHRIRKVSAGIITTVAGIGTAGYSGDGGEAIAAQLNSPYGVSVDSAGNLYIADTGNNRIRKVSGGMISTIAGTGAYGYSGDGAAATSAQFRSPTCVSFDSSGNLYIADCDNSRIRKIDALTGVISLVAGIGTIGHSGDGGPAISAQLAQPTALAITSDGTIYVAGNMEQYIRKISGGIITTIAGAGSAGFSGDGGPATSAELYTPYGIAVDQGGNIYIADRNNNRIRKVSGGIISTIAGTGAAGFSGDGGAASAAQLDAPTGIAVDQSGRIYIADLVNNRVRMID